MPRYLSEHALACMTRQAAAGLLERLAAASDSVKFRRSYWNFQEGRMVAEFEAPHREAVQQWLEQLGLPYRWLMQVEYESEGVQLIPAT